MLEELSFAKKKHPIMQDHNELDIAFERPKNDFYPQPSI